jgi:hypothetical protein
MGQPQRPSISDLEQMNRADEVRVETPDDAAEKPPKGRAAKSRRRSSIPDLMNEAKKLVWGNRMTKTAGTPTDRPNLPVANSEGGAEKRKSFRKGERNTTTNKPRIERRSTLKQLKAIFIKKLFFITICLF